MPPATSPSLSISRRLSRRNLIAVTVFAVSCLLGTHLVAAVPPMALAAPESATEAGQSVTTPASTGLCAVADDTTVYDDASLRTAVAQSNDDSVICIGASFTVPSEISIDDTGLTIAGRDDSAVALTGAGANRLFTVMFDDSTVAKSVTFRDLTLQGGSTTGEGGALYIGNSGASGSIDDTVHLHGVNFLNNSSTTTTDTEGGGAVRAVQLGALIVEGSTFFSNLSNFDGGAIHAAGSTLVSITDSIFNDNSANAANTKSDGGAIYAPGVARASIIDSHFTGNEAGQDAGAILFTAGDITVTGSTFTHNTATRRTGGAIYAVNSDVSISDSTFTGNQSGGRGGAVYAQGKSSNNAQVASSTFIGNQAGSEGGALGSTSNLTVSDSAFINNAAKNSGGAIYQNDQRTVAIASSLFEGNDLTGTGTEGGALYFKSDGGDVSIIDSSFVGNGDDTAANVGGAISANLQVSLTIENSTIVNNLAVSAGAGVFLFDPTSNATLDDTIAFTTIANNTLTGSGEDGAGIYLETTADDTGTARIYNSIITDNDDSVGNASDIHDNIASIGILSHSLVTSATSSNIANTVSVETGSALLAAPANNGGTLVGDDSAYYLPTAIPAWNSPAVGTADPTLAPSVTTTQIGAIRVDDVAGAMNAADRPAPTPPAPSNPPSAPAAVTAEPGAGQATITWTAPSSAGSFPVTNYQAVLSPGGASCLVQAPALTCTISGLTNGTEYTATVRALNGAGWGVSSSASDPFTPEEPVSITIVISGSRTKVDDRSGVVVNGLTTGLVGASVQARVKLRGQVGYQNGSARIVQSDGTFEWQRKTNKKVYVYFVADDGEVRSNRVIIAAR